MWRMETQNILFKSDHYSLNISEWEYFWVKLKQKLSWGAIVPSGVFKIRNWTSEKGNGILDLDWWRWEIELSLMIISVSWWRVIICLLSAFKSFRVDGWLVVAQLIRVSLQVLLFENTIQIQNFEFFLWPFLNLSLSDTCVGPMWDLYGTHVGPVWDWRPEWTWSLTIISSVFQYYFYWLYNIIPYVQ